MFTKSGIIELHATMHERLDLAFSHVASVPDNLSRKQISGFGLPSIWKQLVHILNCEDFWIHNLQNKQFADWHEEDFPTMPRVVSCQRAVASNEKRHESTSELSREEQLNATLAKRPVDWGGELRSPAFILLHVITHAFHHKGQVVAMLRIVGSPAPDTDLQSV